MQESQWPSLPPFLQRTGDRMTTFMFYVRLCADKIIMSGEFLDKNSHSRLLALGIIRFHV